MASGTRKRKPSAAALQSMLFDEGLRLDREMRRRELAQQREERDAKRTVERQRRERVTAGRKQRQAEVKAAPTKTKKRNASAAKRRRSLGNGKPAGPGTRVAKVIPAPDAGPARDMQHGGPVQNEDASEGPATPRKRWSGARVQPLLRMLQERLAARPSGADSPGHEAAAAVAGRSEADSKQQGKADGGRRDLKTMYALVKGKMDVTCGASGRFGMTGHVQQVR